MPQRPDLASRLLDAQVRHHLDRLTGGELDATLTRLVGQLLGNAEEHPLDDLVEREEIKAVVADALTSVPGSSALGGIVELVTTVVHDGPDEPYPLGEVVDRQRVEALLDEVLALDPVLERALDRLTDSPLVGTMASRFMGRIVGEVLQANRTVADKVPGLGSLMSFGTTAASRAMGAADKQFEALIGGTVGKGGTFAVRRLNKIVLETLRDPTTREALLQVWDLLAQEEVAGLGHHVEREEIAGVVEAGHALVASTLAHERVAELAGAVVDAFFERFGARTLAELVGELGLDSDRVVADLVRLATPLVGALRDSGELERILRDHLEPFFDSAEVRELLG